ncbi:DUF2254 family protein [Halococcus saccharolyticus]|uniref:DUF2254 family protein n=1 Tax=Halococcus saccharolyticus TaxID=62319 RepID=UPI001375B4E5|nr:DUF2254 family protein [Halococcus saccharolyticus]
MDDASLPQRTVVVVLPLFIVSTALAARFGQSIGANGIEILTILASAQAAIFAIVFSITILGVQLSASGFSPRLVNLFREDDSYRFTTALFGTSIGIDILGLYLFSGENIFVYEMYLCGAGALAVGSLVVLYSFVDRILYQSTPEGILRRIKDQLSPEWTTQQAHLFQEDSTKRDPYHLLISVIDSAVEDRDNPTVSQGLNMVSEKIRNLLEYTHPESLGPESALGKSIEDLCTDRLPTLVERATENSQKTQAREVIECLDTIGEAGINREHEYVVKCSSQGLSRPVESLGYSELEDRVRKRIIDTNRELLAETAEATQWEAADHGIRLLGWRAAQSIMDRSAQHARDTGYTSVQILSIPSIHSSATAEASARTDDEDIDWQRGEDADFNELYPRENTLRGCYFAMCEITSAAIRSEIRTGRSVVNWSHVATGWRNCLNDLRNSNLELLFQLWLGTILYIEYLQSETDDEVLSGFNRVSIQMGIRDQISGVVDSIQNGSIRPKTQIDYVPGMTKPTEMPLTGFKSQPIPDLDTTFSEWLELQSGMGGAGGFV